MQSNSDEVKKNTSRGWRELIGTLTTLLKEQLKTTPREDGDCNCHSRQILHWINLNEI